MAGAAVGPLPRGVARASHGVRVGRRAEARLRRQGGADVAGAGLGPYRPRDRCANLPGHGDRGQSGGDEARCGRGRSTEIRDRAVEVSAGHGSAAPVGNGCIGFVGDRPAIGTGRGRGRSAMVATRGVRVGWVGHRELPGHDTKIRSFMPRSSLGCPSRGHGKEAALQTILTRRRVRFQSVPPRTASGREPTEHMSIQSYVAQFLLQSGVTLGRARAARHFRQAFGAAQVKLQRRENEPGPIQQPITLPRPTPSIVPWPTAETQWQSVYRERRLPETQLATEGFPIYRIPGKIVLIPPFPGRAE